MNRSDEVSRREASSSREEKRWGSRRNEVSRESRDEDGRSGEQKRRDEMERAGEMG